ncbi:hypothetical protein [Sphingomonas sp.]
MRGYRQAEPARPWRERVRERGGAIALTLAIEALVVMALLTISPSFVEMADKTMATFDVTPDSAVPSPEIADPEEAQPEPPAAETAPPESTPAPAEPAVTPPTAEAPPPPEPVRLPFIELSRETMRAADIARPATPAAPAPNVAARRAPAGPPVPANLNAGDTPRVEGTGPNGEPLYAASWYREPYPEELRGYLQTASGPGWGLIACRTVADYRVADCVALNESPDRSNIARAALAAAWQFRVRPPTIGGRPQVGEWVRIRIDYGMRER